MTHRLKVIVDADAIIALIHHNDEHHKTANMISQALVEMNAQIIYPSTAIVESNAFIQRPLNSTASAYASAIIFTNPHVTVAEVNQQTIKAALNYFSPSTSKKNTLFDCIVAAIAYEEKADAIFSFDAFYRKIGFRLASDIVSLNS